MAGDAPEAVAQQRLPAVTEGLRGDSTQEHAAGFGLEEELLEHLR